MARLRRCSVSVFLSKNILLPFRWPCLAALHRKSHASAAKPNSLCCTLGCGYQRAVRSVLVRQALGPAGAWPYPAQCERGERGAHCQALRGSCQRRTAADADGLVAAEQARSQPGQARRQARSQPPASPARHVDRRGHSRPPARPGASTGAVTGLIVKPYSFFY